MNKRVAFVVQRCGLEVNGGSELHCLRLAQKIAPRFSTEVLTTCALDYVTWANHYPPGEQRVDGLCLRRFPVAQPRDPSSFRRLSDSIRSRIGTLKVAEEEAWMRAQGPWSPELFEYIEARKRDYDVFIFFTYLYATTYFGLPRVADKALLVPTAHDEWPIYLRIWDRLIEMPQAFVFNTCEESAFMRRRFPQARLNGPVVGVAVDQPAMTHPESFRAKHSIDNPFVLYVGRLELAKGIAQLLDDFQSYQRTSGDARTELVLVGRPAVEIPPRPGVRSLGFLAEEDKWDAISACEAVIVPSAYESLSMACLEAWTVGKPVLVNGHSKVLVGQCRRSQGGLWYRNSHEFCAALETLVGEPSVRHGLGTQGQAFVNANYRWPQIIDAYSELISNLGS